MGRNRIGCVLDLLHLSLVMLNNLGFLFAGEVAYSRCPYENGHDVAAADPTLILMVSVNAPLC